MENENKFKSNYQSFPLSLTNHFKILLSHNNKVKRMKLNANYHRTTLRTSRSNFMLRPGNSKNRSAIKLFKESTERDITIDATDIRIESKRLTEIIPSKINKHATPMLLTKYSHNLKSKMNTIRVTPKKLEINEECNITPKASFYERQTNNSTPISFKSSVFGPRLMFKVNKVEEFPQNCEHNANYKRFVPEFSSSTQECYATNRINLPKSRCGPVMRSPGRIFATCKPSLSHDYSSNLNSCLTPLEAKETKKESQDFLKYKLQFSQLKANINYEESRIKALDRKILKQRTLINSLNSKLESESKENTLLNDLIIRTAHRVLIYFNNKM